MGRRFSFILWQLFTEVFWICKAQDTSVGLTCPRVGYIDTESGKQMFLKMRELHDGILSSDQKLLLATVNSSLHVDRLFYLLNSTRDTEVNISLKLFARLTELEMKSKNHSTFLVDIQKILDSGGPNSFAEWKGNVGLQMATLLSDFRNIYENVSRRLIHIADSADYWRPAIFNNTFWVSNTLARLIDLHSNANLSQLMTETAKWRESTAQQLQLVMRNQTDSHQYHAVLNRQFKDLFASSLTDMQRSFANVSEVQATTYRLMAHDNFLSTSNVSKWSTDVTGQIKEIVGAQRNTTGAMLQLMQRFEDLQRNLTPIIREYQLSTSNDLVEGIKLRFESILAEKNFILSIGQMREWSLYMSPSFATASGTDFYTGCQDARNRGRTEAGVYSIGLRGRPEFRVWCQFDGNLGWAVIQRRFDGSVEFFRNFQDYSDGFGSLWGEYWLGLKNIYQLSARATKLSVYLETFHNQRTWANYSSFRVSDAVSLYRLYVSGYSGTADDALSYSNGAAFSTVDQDRDESSSNCALTYFGAWWYKNCHLSNLNGNYAGLKDVYASCSWYYQNVWTRMKLTLMMVNA